MRGSRVCLVERKMEFDSSVYLGLTLNHSNYLDFAFFVMTLSTLIVVSYFKPV